MPWILVLAGALVALCPAVSSAQPIHLNAEDCAAAGRTPNIAGSDCASNLSSASRSFVSSFVAPHGVDDFVAVTTILRVRVAGGTLPPWWQMGSGQCSLGRYDQGAAGAAGLARCRDPFVGNQGGGHRAVSGDGGPDRATITSDWAQDVGVRLDPGVEYYAQIHTLRATKTTGAGSCAGCEVPACIVLDEIQLYQGGIPPPPPIVLSTMDALGTYVIWQGADTGGCGGTITARRRTWGELKGLYR